MSKPASTDKREPTAKKAAGKDAKDAIRPAAKAVPRAPAPKAAPTRPAAVPKPHKPTIAFPKKNQPPTPAAFAARFPVAVGKRVDQVRTFLTKQPGVSEDVYYYGPQTGWALRYL